MDFIRSYLHRKGIPFAIVRSNNGSLYATCQRRRVVPSQVWRWSTRDYKITPIYAHYRTLNAHVYQYLALAYDEVSRIKDSGSPSVTNIFPLIDRKLNRDDCVRIIRASGFSVPPKSGCFFCPFNNVARWHGIYCDNKDLFWKAVKLEERSKHFPRQRLTPLTLRVLAKQFRKGELPMAASPEKPCGAECLT